jgi:hypothetical protein
VKLLLCTKKLPRPAWPLGTFQLVMLTAAVSPSDGLGVLAGATTRYNTGQAEHCNKNSSTHNANISD